MDRVTINKEIDLEASPKLIFALLTDPNEIPLFYPVERVESECKRGGSIKYFGSFDDEPFIDHGTIDVYKPGERFQYTYWSTNHGTVRTHENHMTINYALEPSAVGTKLTVAHSAKSDAMDGQYVAIMGPVWDSVLGSLKDYVERTLAS